eukprot:CAMPEP_0170820886 /NCGR_PEP_ID=MMETSP0733-20121128/42667_1 /TAXON_ID=186038 /ORGANISM="Fragilariopsis kerguelensis, Strain L26-C5" /LENGTH=218 /DNA_ID=CAMNT_0011182413 /DNA_START=435 /DNA_END=1088 /DNA_ORIENTATION=+
MDMLAVECVSEEITKVIHRIVSEYEHRTSFASLAFLSTPEVNADSVLTPLIIKFLRHLQAEWERLVKECESKNLQCIELPPNVCSTAENVGSLCNNPDAVRQALRDLRREIITVNGHVLPPVTSRKELVSMLTQTLNSRTLTASSSREMRAYPSRSEKSGHSFLGRKSSPSRKKTENDSELGSDEASSIEKRQRKFPLPAKKNTDVISDISEHESSIL